MEYSLGEYAMIDRIAFWTRMIKEICPPYDSMSKIKPDHIVIIDKTLKIIDDLLEEKKEKKPNDRF